jgi:hypothetical protein
MMRAANEAGAKITYSWENRKGTPRGSIHHDGTAGRAPSKFTGEAKQLQPTYSRTVPARGVEPARRRRGAARQREPVGRHQRWRRVQRVFRPHEVRRVSLDSRRGAVVLAAPSADEI